MKHFWKLLIIALLCLALSAIFAACGEEHTHTYSEEWSQDSTHHWHAATCDHSEVSDKAEHDFDEGVVTVDPTCSAVGTKTFTCKTCGATKTEEVSMIAHTYEGAVTTDPTCSAVGTKTFTCKTCGTTKTEEIPAVAHTYANQVFAFTLVDGTLYREKCCDACAAAPTERTALENAVIVSDAAAAQNALDAAVEGTVIYLDGDVDYGTLYLRTRSTDREVNVGNWAGGNNMYYRSIKNLTVIGSESATLDELRIEAGTYTPTGNQHSNSATAPHLRSFISIEGLNLFAVHFTGNADAAVSLTQQLFVDGITFNGCSMTDTGDSRLVYRMGEMSTYTDSITGQTLMTTGLKNVSILNCQVSGAHMVAELRATENVTVFNNTFENIAAQVILLPVQDGTYTGAIQITNNTVSVLSERFIRINGSSASITVTGNRISGYNGADADIVKITKQSGTTTVEGNDWGNAELTVTVSES